MTPPAAAIVRPTPTVSVCVPARNAEGYLAQTLESVLAQSWGPSEIIVCDNGSSDKTQDICVSYAAAGVRHHRFDTVVGQAGNWNRCVDLAAGDYLVLLHADDLLMPDFLRRAVDFHESHPTVVLVHCGVEFIDSKGQWLGRRLLEPHDAVVSGVSFLRRLLTEGCIVSPAGVMLRKAALTRVGRFTARIEWGIDWHMWMRMCLVGDIGYLGEPLSKYRIHGGSGTTQVLTRGHLAADELWAAEDVLASAVLAAPDARKLHRQARYAVAHRAWCHAERACEEGHSIAAARGLAAAVSTDWGLLFERRTWGLGAGVVLGFPVYRWMRQHLGAGSAPTSAGL